MPFIRIRIRTILLCSLSATCFLLLLLTLNQKKSAHQIKRHQQSLDPNSGSGAQEGQEDSSSEGGHKLCVLVPFRDRFDELITFVPHISTFLHDQQVEHSIYVINQVDSFRFNRASLINAGYLFARNDDRCDYVALHDVDLLPDNPALLYSYPHEGPFHMSPPGLHPKYDYPNFIGGIMLMTNIDFETVNGMSNRYWGWGLEDDEFFARIKDAGMKISRPENIATGPENTFRHYHSGKRRSRDYQYCFNQRDVTRRRDRDTGLDSVRFEVKQVKRLSVDGHVMNLVDVWLECDRARTPWCDCQDAPATEAPLAPMDAKDNIMPYLPKKKKKKGKRT